MGIERMASENLVVHTTRWFEAPFDHDKQTITALNSTAGAAWDACGSARPLPVTEEMQRPPCHVSENSQPCISELEAKNPVKRPREHRWPTRDEVHGKQVWRQCRWLLR
jgi:hypothetical protein